MEDSVYPKSAIPIIQQQAVLDFLNERLRSILNTGIMEYKVGKIKRRRFYIDDRIRFYEYWQQKQLLIKKMNNA